LNREGAKDAKKSARDMHSHVPRPCVGKTAVTSSIGSSVAQGRQETEGVLERILPSRVRAFAVRAVVAVQPDRHEM
jgi:hypothetical protein